MAPGARSACRHGRQPRPGSDRAPRSARRHGMPAHRCGSSTDSQRLARAVDTHRNVSDRDRRTIGSLSSCLVAGDFEVRRPPSGSPTADRQGDPRARIRRARQEDNSMRTHSTSTRIRRTAAVVVAGVATGLVATAAVAANDRPETPSIRELQVERAEIAEWANEHELSGLSPASLSAAGGRIIATPARCRARSHRRLGERAGALRSLPGVSAAGGRMSRPARHRISQHRRIGTRQGGATADSASLRWSRSSRPVGAAAIVLPMAQRTIQVRRLDHRRPSALHRPSLLRRSRPRTVRPRRCRIRGARRSSRPRRFRSESMSTAVSSRTTPCGHL